MKMTIEKLIETQSEATRQIQDPKQRTDMAVLYTVIRELAGEVLRLSPVPQGGAPCVKGFPG